MNDDFTRIAWKGIREWRMKSNIGSAFGTNLLKLTSLSLIVWPVGGDIHEKG
jgi:hypothetical protein